MTLKNEARPVISSLKETVLFRGMSEDEIAHALDELHALERTYEKGETVFHAGSPTDCMGLVLSGSVTIENNDLWGNCTILSHVGRGQFFAETYALLPQEVMLVDGRANPTARILLLDATPVLGGASAPWKDKITRNLLLISMQKNLILSGRSFHTAPKTIRGRILSYLNTVSLQTGSCEFDIPFDRQQLADYLNLERTGLSKELGKMQREGILTCRKNHFRLIRPAE